MEQLVRGPCRMLEPGLADHSFASLLAEPAATAMLAGDPAAAVRSSGKKGDGDLLNGSDGGGGSNRCGVAGGRPGGGGGGGAGLELQQQASGTIAPPPLLPATTTNGDKCEGSATPYTLPHGAYSLPSTPNIFSTSIYTPGLAPHPPPEPRDMFAAPFSALTFPFQVLGSPRLVCMPHASTEGQEVCPRAACLGCVALVLKLS